MAGLCEGGNEPPGSLKASKFQMKTLKRLFCVIESFTWENMPLIDEETGKMTMAEWIPRIEKFVKRSLSFALALHIVQASVRVTTTDEMIYNTMYPFDILQSPVYEIILMTQQSIIQLLNEFREIASVLCCVHFSVEKIKSSIISADIADHSPKLNGHFMNGIHILCGPKKDSYRHILLQCVELEQVRRKYLSPSMLSQNMRSLVCLDLMGNREYEQKTGLFLLKGEKLEVQLWKFVIRNDEGIMKVRFSLLEFKWKYVKSLEKSVDISEDEVRQIEDKLYAIIRLHQEVISRFFLAGKRGRFTGKKRRVSRDVAMDRLVAEGYVVMCSVLANEIVRFSQQRIHRRR
ncbi:hypothetical protein ANN_17332 [Periplaneta americana]|uniref:Uncharacterized protein n=1 Tax=Periplaneta americana TaxID=6978 RepID=A0ABQ8SU20_PERAM|nr:hypothetical protein ANN_17332 [Periplaneta americana]